MRALPILCLCVLAGCFSQLGGYSHASGEQLTRRASFDLDCAENNLRYRMIDARTQGVAGCGRRAAYIEQCSQPTPHSETECTWLLNGVIEGTASSSAPGASPAR